MRHLRLLASYARLYLLWSFAGRSWTLTLVTVRLVPPLIGLAIWRAALPGRNDIVLYYVALMLVRLLVVAMERYTFAPRVYEGLLADDLLQPRPVVVHILGWNIGSRLYNLIVVLPLAVVAGWVLHVSVSLRLVVIALPAILLAAGLRFLSSYSVSMTAFWTQQAGAATDAVELLGFLFGGEAVPLPLLAPGLRGVMNVLPFRFMVGFPTEVVAGMTRGGAVVSGLGLQSAWVLAFVVLNVALYRAGVRRFTAVGG